jgi:arylsulfatase A-like enzyme
MPKAARELLGDDTLIVFASDNGGSPWFGTQLLIVGGEFLFVV